MPGAAKPGDVKPADAKPAASGNDIGHVHQSSLLASAQQGFIQLNTAARNQKLQDHIACQPPSTSPPSIRSLLKAKLRTKAQLSISLEKSVRFGLFTVSVNPMASPDTTPSCTPDPSAQSASPQLIEDLCLFLANSQEKSGTLEVGMNGFFRLTKLDPGSHEVAADKLALATLPELVDAQPHGLTTTSRQTQYELAAKIISALLHHPSPWLSTRWIKSDFFFLVETDSQALRSTHPLFSLHPRSSSTAGGNQGRPMLWTTRWDNCHQLKNTPVHLSSSLGLCSWNSSSDIASKIATSGRNTMAMTTTRTTRQRFARRGDGPRRCWWRAGRTSPMLFGSA